jgi:hypothetical protein
MVSSVYQLHLECDHLVSLSSACQFAPRATFVCQSFSDTFACDEFLHWFRSAPALDVKRLLIQPLLSDISSVVGDLRVHKERNSLGRHESPVSSGEKQLDFWRKLCSLCFGCLIDCFWRSS